MTKRGYKQTEEQRAKNSTSKLGHEVSEKTKQKMSEARKGFQPSEETKRKMSENHVGMKGKHFTEEVKQRMSKSHTGMYPTEETRKKISESKKGKGIGRHPTEETREKIRLNHGGGYKHCTEKTKKKISESMRGRPHPCSNVPKRICYNGIWFRSGWEAKYAKYFDQYNIKWEYEPHTFLLRIEGRETSYTPDFYLPEFGIYHEVKGWNHTMELGLKKVFAAKEQYDINLTVIDKVWLKRIGVI